MKMPKIKINQKTIASAIGVLVFLVVCMYVSYKAYEAIVNHFIDRKVAQRSECIAKELKTDYLSTDLITCLCREWGGEGYALELEPGVQVNACVIVTEEYEK